MASDGKDPLDWRQALTVVGLALAIPWMIGMPAVFGWYLDKTFGTWPLWFLIWLFAGILAAAFDI
ncbi:MAG TPA: hypothetical protein VNO70_05845, partial [Blastocatellia bacterium]|nr:hypothetical protein [Blastocatellia bacterium]